MRSSIVSRRCSVDARDRLRQYFEQRKELGESEFILDGMSVEDALRAIGMQGALPTPPPRSEQAERPAGPASAARAAADKAGESGDWRAALRSVGADAPSAPVTEKIGRYEMPSAQSSDEAQAAHADAKPGLSIGGDAVSGLGELATIEAVAKAIAVCKACSLYEGATHPVPGEGNPNAGFVIVGEAPGEKEDESGRPFVGQSGQLLEKILGAINFKREDVFICNVLKHRPPGNRNPAPDEIKACSPFLLRQLELLKPKVILALGTFASQTLLQTTTPIGKLRGQVHRFYGVPLIVTYHPAALLRNPSWKRPTWEDVQLARRVFDSAGSNSGA